MKNLKTILLVSALLIAAIILVPNFCHAESSNVDSEDTLINAINSESEDITIVLTKDIELTHPIEIVDKTVTINGGGFTITRDTDNWSSIGNNGTLITAGEGAKLTLSNLQLTNSAKYGVQSYNGGYVVLDGVTISNCEYGAVLVNAGTVEVKNLSLKRNGGDSNNGIEIAKGYSVSTGDNKPTLIMNGTLSSTEKDNVIFLAINDKLTEFEVSNTETSENKILLSGNKVVVTDENNNILYESNERSDLKIDAETFVENITITVHLNDKTIPIRLAPNGTLTIEQLQSQIDLASLSLTNYTIDGFYADAEFKTQFDFTKTITANTDIFVKLTEKPKDVTPKTGVQDYTGIAALISAISIISLVILKRKEF